MRILNPKSDLLVVINSPTTYPSKGPWKRLITTDGTMIVIHATAGKIENKKHRLDDTIF